MKRFLNEELNEKIFIISASKIFNEFTVEHNFTTEFGFLPYA